MTHQNTLCQTMSATFRYLLVSVVLASISRTRGQQQDLTYKIREEQDVGTFVGNIARDSQIYIQYNQTEFQSLQYSIPSTSSKFTIDSKSSTVRTAVVLDRETECDSPSYLTELCQLNFGVSVYRVSRDGSFTLLRIIKVIVVLEDINDNPPQFPSNETTLDAPESLDVGQVLTTSGAMDRDSSVNNTVQKYTLEGGDGVFELQQIPIPGSMNSDLGIVLKQKLDRETIPSYRLKIIAEDGGFPKLSGTVRILIKVIDVNDNTPTFSHNLYNASVPEDRPERSTILKIEAQDPDEGENGRMTFTFSPLTSSRITEYFAINEANGDIFLVRRLDYERDKLFRFSMTVSDNGSPPRSSQTTIQIFVEDVNDNAPQIEITLPTAYVKESINIGNYIAHVSLSDRDSSENSVITCAVQNEHFMLQKFPESDSIYTVILKSHLDYEKSQTEFVNITCHDGGQPQLYNSSGFMIYVQDVNDNAPVFTRGTYRAEVEEENYVGQFVTQVQAVDPDEGDNGNVSYGLLVNPDSKFQINPLSGVIKAVMTLDREETPNYELVVVAKDRGIPPISSSVTVTVVLTDINDNPPRFTKSIFDFRIQENLPKNTIVDTVTASDPDTGSDNHIRFQFTISFAYRDTFAIDRLTGKIIALKSLDREEHDFYAFDVMVLDESQPTYNDVAKVYVTVTDDNDNKPVITYPDDYNNTFYFVYTYPAGTVLVNFQCEDRDAGENASVRFSIIRGNEKSLFFLNALNGELVLAKQLNIYDAGNYRLSILARDNGLSYLESKRDINVIITIANGTSSFLQDDVTGANIAIVIALVCITVVLAMAVLITICIIRRIDRERKQHSNVKVDDDNLYKQQTMPDNLMHTPGKDGFESEIEKLKRKIKRDMSFGVEDDSNPLDSTEISNKSSTFSTFKNTSTAVEQKNMSSPQAHSSVLQNTLSPTEGNVKRVHYMDKGLDIDRMTTTSPPPRSQALGYHSVRGGHWSAGRGQSPRSSVIKLSVEDSSSHSSGSTSDSGRGGSSEEGEGHGPAHAVVVAIGDNDRGHGPTPTYPSSNKLMTFGSPRSSCNTSGTSHMPSSTSTSLSSETARKRLWGESNTTSATTLPSMPDSLGMSEMAGYYKPNISFSDDSVTANTMVGASRSTSCCTLTDKTPTRKKDNTTVLDQTPSHPTQETTPADRTPLKTPIQCNDDNTYTGTPTKTPSYLKDMKVVTSPDPLRHSDALPPRPSSSTSSAQRLRLYQNTSGTPYRLTPANLSRIPVIDSSTAHGMFIDNSNLSVYEPANQSRSYANANRQYTTPNIGNSYLNHTSARGPSLSSSSGKRLSLDDGYSLQDIDEVLEDASTIGPHADDGNSTTTSGSYTINADDLCQEINKLFFNDIVV